MSLFAIIDCLAVTAGAFSGAAEAARDECKHYDVVGVAGLGLASAVGGGVTRDVLLNRGVPLALVHVRYLIFAFAGILLALACRARISRGRQKVLTVVDAAGLGLFAVAGSTRAFDAGLHVLPSVLLGAVTAAGGGVWRDVLSGRTPAVFERGSPYVLVAVVASAVYFLARSFGAPAGFPTLVASSVGFVMRLVALRLGWKTRAVREITPSPLRRQSKDPARFPTH